ncbi:MAG: hypothetical protein ACRECW_00345 [Phyllobacterium sp.]
MARTKVRRGFFHAVLDGMIAARERQVQRYIDGSLLALGDGPQHGDTQSREKYPRIIYPI